jgi:DNA topoisomerase-1
MKALVIVESPGKIKKIESFLGEGWRVMASVGHIRDLPESATDEHNIGVVPPDFQPQYVLTERGREVVAKLKTAVAASDVVFLATDADREGEAIAWHLAQALALKNATRVTFQEITETAVKAALRAPRAIDTNLVLAQETRRVLDRLVGFMVSPALCKQSGQRLSAGRVQSVAARIVVDRERAIRNFKSTTHYGVRASFDDPAKPGVVWTADWNTKPILGDEPYMLDKGMAERIAQLRKFSVESCETKETSKAPPAPFTTSTLQQAASTALGFNPDETMKHAQSLYEQGVITYHRTDATNLAAQAIAELVTEAQRRGLATVSPARRWKTKDGAQEAHEAIRPTHFDVDAAGENDAERQLYRLIWQRTIACQLEAARYSVRKAILTSSLDNRRIEFIAQGRTLIFKGWLAFLAGDVLDDDEDANEDNANNPVPALSRGNGAQVSSTVMLTQQTQAPSRFTEASLIKKLEEEGVGRPSTYAAILKGLHIRGYIAEKKRQLYATELGEYLVGGLVGKFQFMEVAYTRELELTLDQIAQGQARYKPTIQKVHARLLTELNGFTLAPLATYPCPDCGKPLRRMKGPTGFFWGCSGYNDGCKATQQDVAGKPEAAPVCPTCHVGKLRQIKGSKGLFWACSRFKEGCKATFENSRGRPKLSGGKTTATKTAARKRSVRGKH